MGMALAAAMTVAAPAQAVLDSFGPVDALSPPGHGFPYWYTATDGMSLDLCLDEDAVNVNAPIPLLNPLCLLARDELPDPLAAVSFPDNFWPEVFWTRVDADMPTALDTGGGGGGGTGRALLVTALEGSFFNGIPITDENISFARIRFRIDNPVAGATLRITHPFGTATFANVPAGINAVNFTDDFGIPAVLPPVPDYTGALQGVIGPFLRWTAPDFPVLDQNGNAYIGDPNIPHAMTGSPLGTNFFRVEGPVGLGGFTNLCTDPLLGDDPVDLTDCIETDLFVGSGKLASDMDLDGIPVTVDNCTATANPGQENNDADSFGNACDNCTDVDNEDQRDTNTDGFGNICDADLDGVGTVDLSDFSLFRSAFGTADPDADFNGDGAVDLSDFSTFREFFGSAPGPSGLNP
jgi:hypothetical protein